MENGIAQETTKTCREWSEPRVESGVPLPPMKTAAKYNPYLEPIARMNVGDSFVFDAKVAPRVRDTFAKFNRKCTMRMCGDGSARVWRLA